MLDRKSLEKLSKATSARDFFAMFFGEESLADRPLSYSEFCRRAGFSSKSFPREILLGRRSITLKSLPKFIKGLKLKGPIKDLFVALVELEQFKAVENSVALDRISALRNQVCLRSKRKELSGVKSISDQLFAIPEVPKVLAFLGQTDVGVPMPTLLSRTQMTNLEIQSTLSLLEKLDLIVLSENNGEKTVIPKNLHLALSQCGGSEYFRRFFLQTCGKLKGAAELRMKSTDELFLASYLSVKRQKLPEFKNQLRDLALRFAEETETPDGEELMTLCVGFFKN